MIVVVSGYRRSGTSAMMSALGAGGIPLIAIQEIEQMNVGVNGYKPNPGGLYEVGRSLYMQPFILHQLLKDGHAIKIFFDGLPTLPAGDYKIIYMQRDPEEINASLEKALQNVRAAGKKPQKGGNKPFDVFSPYAQKEIDWVLGICKQRRDMDLQFVEFHELINNPHDVLASLNLPINVDMAAGVIKPEYHRVRGNYHGSKRVGSL